jgi:hypothetical protein
LKRTKAEEREEQLGIVYKKAERHYSIEQLKEIMALKKKEIESENKARADLLNKYDYKLGKYTLRIRSVTY